MGRIQCESRRKEQALKDEVAGCDCGAHRAATERKWRADVVLYGLYKAAVGGIHNNDLPAPFVIDLGVAVPLVEPHHVGAVDR